MEAAVSLSTDCNMQLTVETDSCRFAHPFAPVVLLFGQPPCRAMPLPWPALPYPALPRLATLWTAARLSLVAATRSHSHSCHCATRCIVVRIPLACRQGLALPILLGLSLAYDEFSTLRVSLPNAIANDKFALGATVLSGFLGVTISFVGSLRL